MSRVECPAITARQPREKEIGGVSADPFVWEKALGANVLDVDGNRLVDLTSAFSVAGIGHSHPRVQAAIAEQATRLIHGMGDVYPPRVKIELSEKLAHVVPGDLEMSILCTSGASAVEAALKTANMATKRQAVIAFSSSYHGLHYGALNVTGYRREFKEPFRSQTGHFAVHMPYAYCYRCALGLAYPTCRLACLTLLKNTLDDLGSGIAQVGAVLVEPILGRGGVVIPPDEWLVGLFELCREREILIIADEILTGFGRTGRWFACDWPGLVPDMMCIGKGMGGGFPIAAVIGKPAVMTRWGLSSGEAIHTSTFLGNPLGCAAALAAIQVLEEEKLVERSRQVGEWMADGLDRLQGKCRLVGDVRCRGSLAGIELVTDRESRTPATRETSSVIQLLLERGYIVGLNGVHSNIIGLTPPFVITQDQIRAFFQAFEEALESCDR
ncbi:MAG: aspartate aminotransferase family protein [Bradymonadales bacterium]|nr:aspartate aminotransferase family protein [Bradymonadales bacterium]